MTKDILPELPAGAFAKQDAGDDLAFYAPPRLVTHIDEDAVAALTAWYRARLPADGRVLDLMSSWISHLPSDRQYSMVVGHGMNAAELAANPRLDCRFVQDLNRDPILPLEDQSFDAALCCVGVQYLQRPLAVFGEIRRVLTPGSPSSSASRTAVFRPRRSQSGRRWTPAVMPHSFASISSALGSQISPRMCWPMAVQVTP